MENYEILATAGEGSYGIVMKCRNRYSNKIVAIKKLTDVNNDNCIKKIVLREARILKKLRHENLVQLFEVFKKKKRYYLVFEYLEKTILDELDDNPDGLGERQTLEYTYQIIRAIDFCHSKNVIHRDIKPENLLISMNGILKLCDFGCARVLSNSPDGIYTDYVATRWYRAPELLVRDREYGKPVDIWAVGCVFAEMLTGEPLFPGQSDVDQIYMITKCLGQLCSRHQQILNANFHHTISISKEAKMESENSMNSYYALHKMFPSWSINNLNFTMLCLCLDPAKRPTANELLIMECFKEKNINEFWFNSLLQNIKEIKQTSPTMKEFAFKCTSNSNFNHSQCTPHNEKFVLNRASEKCESDICNIKDESLKKKNNSSKQLPQQYVDSSTTKDTFLQANTNLVCYTSNERCSSTDFSRSPALNGHQCLSPLTDRIKNRSYKKYETRNKYNTLQSEDCVKSTIKEKYNIATKNYLNLPILRSKQSQTKEKNHRVP